MDLRPSEIASADAGDDVRAMDVSEVGRGGLLNLAGVVSATLFSFLLVVIVTRGLGATPTGLFFEGVAFFNIIGTVAVWGAEVGIVRTIPRYLVRGRLKDVRHAIAAALGPVTLIASVLGLALAFFAEPLGSLATNGAHGAELAPMLVVLAPFLPVFAAYTVVLAATRGFGTMLPTTVIDKVGRAALQPLLVLPVVVLGWAGVALSLAWAIPFAAGLVAAAIWLSKLVRSTVDVELGAQAVARGRAKVAKAFWRFTAPRGLAGLFAVAVLWLSTLLLGAFRSVEEAGVYAAAARYLIVGQFIGVAISQVVGPKLSQVLATGDRARARSVYAISTWWLMALAWPLYILMITMAPGLLSIFGPGYGAAVPVLVIMGATMLVATAVGPVDMVLLMAGRSVWNLANTIVAATVNILLNIWLIPRFGIAGAAVAWSASVLINNLVPLAQVWGAFGLQPFGVGSILAAVAATACYGGAAVVVRGFSDTLGVGSVVLCALVATPPYLLLLRRWRVQLHLGWVGTVIRRRSTAGSAATDAL